MYGSQQMRPENERELPSWQLEALDRQRAAECQNAVENPAIWRKLAELEAKIDRILTALSRC